MRSSLARNVARGRAYAAEGRVAKVVRSETSAIAIVRGTKPYSVAIDGVNAGATRCSCPAFDRDEQCKHLVALALTLTVGGALEALQRPVGGVESEIDEGARGRRAPRRSSARSQADTSPASPTRTRARIPLPPIVASAYSTSAVLSRLPLFVGKPVVHDVDRYWPLADWWRSAGAESDPHRRLVADVAVELASIVETLRTWKPPALPRASGQGFSDFYRALVRVYETRARDVRIGYGLPGPLDERHPGFDVSYVAKRRVFELREKSPDAASRLALAVVVPLDQPEQTLLFRESAFGEHDGAAEAWDLFALRAMISVVHARTDPAARELAADLDRPIWDHVLDELAERKTASVPREWAFCLGAAGGSSYVVTALSRPLSTSSKAGRWKKEKLEVLFEEDVLDVERDIARLALVGERGRRGGAPAESLLVLGTAHAHELLRRLAEHPRVFVGSHDDRADPERYVPAEIVAGRATMTLDRAANGLYTPRFFVDGEPLPVAPSALGGDRSSCFRTAASAKRLVALEIPSALRSWVDMAARFGGALSFPDDAVPKLVQVTQSLVRAGLVALPRAALGDELSYEPKAALRVEWRYTDGGVEVMLEVMIQTRPGAPFVAAGSGPKLFTFEHEGKRVFVERDLRRELAIAGETLERVDADVSWVEGVGRVSEVGHALALASWLEANPLALPIEVKVGRPPIVHALADLKSKIVVRKIGAWLRLDATVEVGAGKVSLGELLEAARHARRYVRVGDGSFLELSKQVIDKLVPVATAASLAPARLLPAEPEGALAATVVNDAFGTLIPDLTALFATVEAKGVDLLAYAQRFEARERQVRVPALEGGTLRDYQREGVEWMLRLASWAPGCVLADDMGLGKTVQTAVVLKARAKLGPALVVAPASVSSNWVAELSRFMPSLAVRFYNEDRTVTLGELAAGDVLVVSYQLLQRQSATFSERRWATLVIDEAQYVKNVATQRSGVVRKLARDFTIALTGTPLENHLGELFSIVDIAFPGLLGDEATFREFFRRPIEAHREGERLRTLAHLLGPFLLRRTRKDVLQELPLREEITEHLELSLAERKRYAALRKVCEDSLKRQSRVETPAQLRIVLLAALTRLRQMACDIRLVDPAFDGPSTKIARVVELVKELAAEGNHALVFSQFTQFLEKVEAALALAGLRVASLTGATPTTKRRPLVDAFQAGEYDVFCVSLLAGGTGLNLTRASYVIHLDPWWNPAAEEQATSRAHRMGQTSPVTVYRLVSRGTIEEAVLEMHADKRELASAVLEGKGAPKAMTSTELLGLLRFGA